MNRKGMTLGEVIVVVFILGVLAAIALPVLTHRRHLARRSACVNNLKQMGQVLNLYANENGGKFPPLGDAKNNFMLDASLLYPEYLTDVAIVACPGDAEYNPSANFRLTSKHPVDNTPRGSVHPDCVTDMSYIYLGWMIMDDEEAGAFFEAYDEMTPEDYDKDISVPEGKGNADGSTLNRLAADMDKFLITDTNIIICGNTSSASVIPIMWDQISTNSSEFNHAPSAHNVLYLDGHVDFYRYDPTDVYFPTTPLAAAQFGGRAREPIPYCE